MEQQKSYCLDVFIEGEEKLRENLIDFLKKVRKDFDVTKGQCGNWKSMRSLRILTPQAKQLTFYMLKNIGGAEDYSYDEFYSKDKAEGSPFWDPDKNKPFDFVDSEP